MGIEVWNENDKIDLSAISDKTLNSFLKYRREVLMIKHPHDNAQLLTNQTFIGGVIGKRSIGLK